MMVGDLPAHMVLSYWTIRPSQRGDLDAFTFPIHRPLSREAINEPSCPICLKEKPKPESWVIFDVCHHATCKGCFKRLVAQYRLHAACPICRSMLAKGKGDRGCPRQQVPPLSSPDVADQPAPPANTVEEQV